MSSTQWMYEELNEKELATPVTIHLVYGRTNPQLIPLIESVESTIKATKKSTQVLQIMSSHLAGDTRLTSEPSLNVLRDTVAIRLTVPASDERPVHKRVITPGARPLSEQAREVWKYTDLILMKIELQFDDEDYPKPFIEIFIDETVALAWMEANVPLLHDVHCTLDIT